MECRHKWKIIKEIAHREKSLFARLFFTNKIDLNTIYHLQCSKCGDIRQRWAGGISHKTRVTK